MMSKSHLWWGETASNNVIKNTQRSSLAGAILHNFKIHPSSNTHASLKFYSLISAALKS